MMMIIMIAAMTMMMVMIALLVPIPNQHRQKTVLSAPIQPKFSEPVKDKLIEILNGPLYLIPCPLLQQLQLLFKRLNLTYYRAAAAYLSKFRPPLLLITMAMDYMNHLLNIILVSYGYKGVSQEFLSYFTPEGHFLKTVSVSFENSRYNDPRHRLTCEMHVK